MRTSLPSPLSALLALPLLLSACGGPEGAVKAAIEAANADDPAAFRATLDEPSASLVDRITSDKKRLPSDWQIMRGRPWLLLKGAEIASSEEKQGHVALVKLKGGAPLREVWVLEVGENVFPRWRVHLLGSKGLYDVLRGVGEE